MQNFNNPYGYPYNIPQPQQKTNTYAFVNGIEGAKSYMMQPNQMVMLLDSDRPIIYKKTSNGYGQSTIECFEMVSISEEKLRGTNTQPNAEYVTKAEFDALKLKIEELTKKEETNNA